MKSVFLIALATFVLGSAPTFAGETILKCDGPVGTTYDVVEEVTSAGTSYQVIERTGRRFVTYSAVKVGGEGSPVTKYVYEDDHGDRLEFSLYANGRHVITHYGNFSIYATHLACEKI